MLAIDVGSSSLRAIAYDHRALAIPGSMAQVKYPRVLTPDGGVEIDPTGLLDAATWAIDNVLQTLGESSRGIEAVGMCSLVANVMGVDSSGRPVTPIYTWADTRGAAEVARLKADVPEEETRQRTGCYFHTSYLPARLLWLKRTQPEKFASATRWISLGEWLHLNFLGRGEQSLSVASWGGLLNRTTAGWYEPLLDYLGISAERLPPLSEGAAITGLAGSYAARWPALRSASWLPCESDGVTGNLGSGCDTPARVAVQVGTSSAIRVMAPGTVAAIPGGLWCYLASREVSLLGGALSEGGNLLDWLRAMLGARRFAEAARKAADLEPGAHGLTVLPFIAGERSPGWRPDARAAFAGISLDTRPEELVRAAEESVALRLLEVYSRLRQVIPEEGLVVASGAALRNTPGWLQLLADALGRPVTAPAVQEASSRGAAILALRRLGPEVETTREAQRGRRYKPDEQQHQVYLEEARKQADLYRRLLGPAGR